MFQAINPIVRGQCGRCHHSRNLWVSELRGGGDLPCDHRDRGCSGTYNVVFRGPKGLMPDEYKGGGCTCGTSSGARSGAQRSGQSPPEVQQLLAMGFDAGLAAQALAQNGNDVGAAVDWLTSPEGSAATAAATLQASESAAAAAAASGGARGPLGECAICCEDLLQVDAAMRCLGQGGKKHYFHAKCLGSWVQECQRTGHAPTCPECRGPVQVQPRRVQEFLQDKGGKLSNEDREALDQFQRSASSSADEDGWSDVKTLLTTTGVVLGVAAVAVGIGFAIAKGLSSSSGSDDRDRRRS